MPSPLQTLDTIQRLCELNAEHQPIEWLRYANYEAMPDGTAKWSIKHENSQISLYRLDDEALLLLWVDDEPAPPMDNIKPQWDTSPMVQGLLEASDTFPQAIAWAHDVKNPEWSSIWLGTQWWPLSPMTDAVDNPQLWLNWWWISIMEFTTEPPSLYDSPSSQPVT